MSKSIMEDVKNKALRSSIKFWSSKSKYHKEVINKCIPLIQLIDALDKEKPFGDKKLILFVGGLILIPVARQKKEPELSEMVESMLNPVFGIIRKQVKSKHFQKEVLQKYVLGDEKLWIDDLEVPITIERLQQYLVSKNEFVLTLDDVNKITADYTKYRKKPFLANDQLKEEKPVKILVNKPIEKDKLYQRTQYEIDEFLEKVKSNSFPNDEDYQSFLELLTKFYTLSEYKLPAKPIKLKQHSKTRVSRVLRQIHNKLSDNDNLSGDHEFFKLVRVLSPFSKLDDDNIYSSLTKFSIR